MRVQPLFSAAHHPVVVTPDDGGVTDTADVLAARAVELQALMHAHGGILLRGFAVADAAQFQRCANALGATAADYAGGNSPRTPVLGEVFTSTEFPASETITLHQEMSYLPQWPQRLFFFSQIPPTIGGQTSLAHAADVLGALPADIVDTFRSRRIRYIRNFHPSGRLGKTWQVTWNTEDQSEVEAIIAAQGSRAIWRDDGGLRVETVCDGLLRHPLTRQEVWFNQAEQWHPSALAPSVRATLEKAFGQGGLAHHCEFEDDSPMDEGMLACIRATLSANRLLFDWRRGDVLMIDNVSLMHGREPFRGTRKTLVMLSRS